MGLSVMGLLLVAMAASPLWLLLASRIGKYKVSDLSARAVVRPTMMSAGPAATR